jgi:glycosyltransferase involved in cell wall biosynthesis
MSPRVSIGLPVYNGARYLATALDAWLAQTFTNFEVIISDNASTDATPAICAQYAARDRRIRYSRNAANIGGAPNFRRVFHLATGEYFVWATHDDLHAPTFLERCVAGLDGDPTVVVCYPRVRIIDANGAAVEDDDTHLPRIGSARPHERFSDLVRWDYKCYEMLGLIRASVLRVTPLIASYIASDRALRAELGLRGRFHEVPEYLLFNRDHSERSTRALVQHHLRGAWVDPALAGKRVLPHWRILIEYVRCIRRVPLSRGERLRCYGHLTRWLRVPRNLKWLAADVPIFVDPRAWDAFVRYRAARKQQARDRER